MKQKKLMLLGGSRYLLPAIEAAHKLGAYVITCDFLPNNYAHKFSGVYCRVARKCLKWYNLLSAFHLVTERNGNQ